MKQALEQADPVLLEPIMLVTVSVPEEHVGDVIGDLNGRRGRPQGMEPAGAMTEIKAEVPMAEMLGYAPDLRSITGGQGDYTMEFLRYEEVPAHLAQKVVGTGVRGAGGPARLTRAEPIGLVARSVAGGLLRGKSACVSGRRAAEGLPWEGMATRSITTSRPAVACDVCGRNLLRGELSDVFIAGGPAADRVRAVHRREPPTRAGCARATALRPAPRAAPGAAGKDPDGPAAPAARRARRRRFPSPASRTSTSSRPTSRSSMREEAGLDAASPILRSGAGRRGPSAAPTRAARLRVSGAQPPRRRACRGPSRGSHQRRAQGRAGARGLQRRRRATSRGRGGPLAGCALGGGALRSRGSGTMVSIVVAWELCWYRYEVDLAEEGAGARLLAQGMELDELDELDRAANAAADERGELQMLA